MPQQFKMRIFPEMKDIGLRSGLIIIQANHIISVLEQYLAEVTPDKAGAPGNQNFFHTNPFGPKMIEVLA